MFMGDEWGTQQPFPFFCDFKGELARAVREGRRREFAEAYARHGGEVPDPLAPETVRLATLDWSSLGKPGHAARLDLVRRLLAARKQFVVPLLPRLVRGHGETAFDGGVLTARWRFSSGETLALAANFDGEPRMRPAASRGTAFWGCGEPELAPFAVHAAIEAP
jgi:1,4-alpha-glucan branching enzyme